MPNYYDQSAAIEIQGAVKVNGFQAAMAYPVAPLASIILWNPADNELYIRSGARTGLEPLRVFREFVGQNQSQALPQQNSYNYAQNQSRIPEQQRYQIPQNQSYNQGPTYASREDLERLRQDLYSLQSDVRRLYDEKRNAEYSQPVT